MKINKEGKEHADSYHGETNPEKPICKTQERIGLIEKEAYLVASARGFGPGDALSDWLIAEQRIDNGWVVC